MWDEDELKRFEYESTPEESKLYHDKWETIELKRQLESLRNAALLITSTAWTEEARQYVENVVDNAAVALKSLDDKIKILNLKIKALEDAL